MTDPVMLLSQVHGEGRVTFRALRAAGFFTLTAVAEASIHLLSESAHLSVQTARRLKAGAEEMLDRGIGAPARDEQPGTGSPRARMARSPRFTPKQASTSNQGQPATTFSAGISIEEALLLSGSWEIAPEPFFAIVNAPEPVPETMPVAGARLPEMAAAAEAAASLVRLPPADRAPVPTTTGPAEVRMDDGLETREIGRSPGETFWSFG